MKHDQRPVKALMQCSNCKLDSCEKCVNVMLAKVNRVGPCSCTKKAHSKETDGD